MLLPAHFILGIMIAFMSNLSNVHCDADQCKDDILGTTVFTKTKKFTRVYLEPFRDRVTIHVPKVCVVTQAVKAHACARDVAPYVEVYNFHTVNIHRKGYLDSEIYIDITAYCNAWGGEESQEKLVAKNLLPFEVPHY